VSGRPVKTDFRKIVHMDMDCFYAAVELLEHPELRGRPVAVGGSPKERGVLCTCNYEARTFGVHSAMPSAQALKLCPELTLLPVQMHKYKAIAEHIFGIYAQYTHLIEPLSLDEAFLDVTGHNFYRGSATLLASKIKQQVWEETGLTVSAGIAPNKFLAKIASDWNKPNGLKTITPEEVPQIIESLALAKVFGVGKVTNRRLQEHNLYTCGDLQKLTLTQLAQLLGKQGERLYYLCRGIDDREVQNHRERKSLSVEVTFPQDRYSIEECLQAVEGLWLEFLARKNHMEAQLPINSCFVTIRFNNFQRISVARKSSSPNISIFEELFTEGILRNQFLPVRLMGLGVRFDSPKNAEQLSFLDGIFPEKD
jgi:DNA polymerase IV